MKKFIIIGGGKEALYNKERHIKEITDLNKLFLEEKTENGEKIKRNLSLKLNGYKNQDLKKDRYSANEFILYEQLLEKLIISKLRCYYCMKDVILLYNETRDKKQWSLDRIENNLCHSNDNTVISCLQCNLQKRCRDKDKFKYTKQMRIKKLF